MRRNETFSSKNCAGATGLFCVFLPLVVGRFTVAFAVIFLNALPLLLFRSLPGLKNRLTPILTHLVSVRGLLSRDLLFQVKVDVCEAQIVFVIVGVLLHNPIGCLMTTLARASQLFEVTKIHDHIVSI